MVRLFETVSGHAMVVERLKLSCLEMEEPPVKRRRRQSALELTPSQTLKVTRMLTLHRC